MASFAFDAKSSGMSDADELFRNATPAAKRLHAEAKKLKRAADRKTFWHGRKQMKKPPEGGSDVSR